MVNIRNERNNIVKFLYLYEMNELNFHDAVVNYNLVNETELSDEAQMVSYNILNQIDEIDEIISNNLVNYSIKRLNLVDLQIIRLAVFEMLQKELAPNIIINEAINLAKEYTEIDDFLSSKFNNRLLDNIRKYLDER